MAHILQSLFRVLHSDVTSAVILFRCLCIEPHSIVDDGNFVGIAGIPGGDGDGAAVFFHADTVLDGVLHERLYGKQRKIEACFLYVVLDIEFVLKAKFFYI